MNRKTMQYKNKFFVISGVNIPLFVRVCRNRPRVPYFIIRAFNIEIAREEVKHHLSVNYLYYS